jgi:hypothetical protein
VQFWNWKIWLGISLIVMSVLVYFLHFMIFRDLHHIFIYLIGDVGFVFIEVLLVTLVIHGVLEEREKRARLNKLNMVIGAFFSEVGTTLLELLASKDPEVKRRQGDLAMQEESPEGLYRKVIRFIGEHDFLIDLDNLGWEDLKKILVNKREFMLRLLENPNLLEHEAFTDLLWAVFHLAEELGFRESIDALPESDIKHLYEDINRVYGRLAREWLAYIKHLKDSYPYLFSLALRTNPFNLSASPVVETEAKDYLP